MDAFVTTQGSSSKGKQPAAAPAEEPAVAYELPWSVSPALPTPHRFPDASRARYTRIESP